MRTLEEIENELDTDVADVFTTPSTSQFAEWKLWRSIFAQAVFVFEAILDLFRSEIEDTIQSKQYATKDWYFDRALEFQGGDVGGTFQGDDLEVDEYGLLVYVTPDADRRIIEKCAITADSGTISFKVAKWLSEAAGTYQELDTDEKTAFGLYIDNIKYPGTETTIISEAADTIKYDLEIIYQPEYSTSGIETELESLADSYRQGLEFNDKFYAQRFIDALLDADGVTSIKITSLEGKEDGGSYASIDIVYELVAGYFNFDGTSQFTFTDETTL